jgi:hypothetical protein
VPSAPEISIGESYLIINGIIVVKNPALNPCRNLQRIKTGKLFINITQLAAKHKALIKYKLFLNKLHVYLLENRRMKNKPKIAPNNPPAGMIPLRRLSVTPSSRLIWYISWRVMVGTWVIYTRK